MRKYLVAIALLGGLGLLAPNTASADLLLRISDGVTTQIVLDQDLVGGAASSGGNVSTVADGNATVGAVAFNGVIGSFVVNVIVGTSKPLIGDRLDLFNLNISGGAGTLTVEVTDTGFTTSPQGLKLEIGGTTDGTVTIAAAGDPTNTEFGAGPGPALGPFSTGGAFGGSATAAGPGTSPYSMTMTAMITQGNGDITSFDALLTPVPEPSSLVLVATGLTFFGGTFWRRRRKAAA